MSTKKSDNIILGSNIYDKVLIFNHGLGDDPSSWIFFAKEIIKEIDNIKIILTKSPTNNVSVNNGIEMQSWFDIFRIPIDINDTFGDVSDSVNLIQDLIDNEISNGISINKIFIGGFSQGAALSLILGFKKKETFFGGIISLSGWLIEKEINYFNDIPIFIAHGEKDNIVKFENAKYEYKYLKDRKCSCIIFNRYENMRHNVSFRVRNDVINWLKDILVRT